MCFNSPYSILIGSYAERHYMEDFRKSYGNAREITQEAIYNELYRMNAFLNTTKAEIISSCSQGDIIKCEFAIA